VEEETAEVGGRRQLANVLDIALPTEQRRGPQAGVVGAVVEVEPGPQALVRTRVAPPDSTRAQSCSEWPG
jgi:hypothetical protein